MMTFADITKDGRLWATQYEGDSDNILTLTFRKWFDPVWLEDFFTDHIDDLSSFFRITDLDEAIFDTIVDAKKLRCLILDISPDADLDQWFQHLEPSRTYEVTLGKEKAKGIRKRHNSWLRLYAIKLSPGHYIITGGAIKLTETMPEREHTLQELVRMEKVRNFLLSHGIVDEEGFYEYLQES